MNLRAWIATRRRALGASYRRWRAGRAVRNCCKKHGNLEKRIFHPNIGVLVCLECGRRHFEMDAEAGVLDVERR